MFGVVVATGLGTLIAVIVLLQSSLSAIAVRTDHMTMLRSSELVQAAVESTLDRMTAIATDNSMWDDAVTAAYAPQVDAAWLYENWGSVSDDGKPYDGTFVLDNGQHVLWGYMHGKPYMDNTPAALGSGFDSLFRLHRKELESGSTVVSGLSRMSDGIAVISIGLIRPSETPVTGHEPMRRYLVMTRHLTPDLIQSLGQTFRLGDLRLVPVKSRIQTAIGLEDAGHHTIGRLAWTLHQTGTIAASAAAPKINEITWLISGLVLLFIAISAFGLQKLARSEQEAQTFALVDGLSRLPNRRALFERLQRAGKRRGVVHKTVVFIDLDGFKDVNDIYGHNTGDKLIMIVAAALKEVLPRNAMLARMGGDEFAMLIGGSDGLAKAQAFAEAALAFLSSPVRIGEWSVQVGASIGIANENLKTITSQELFRRADIAMYHSKGTGKNRITHYDAMLDAARQRKAAIEKQIREGLARDEFDVVYQPVIDARSQRICSVEALVRWPRRPDGPLPPDQFIDIAEASGLIHKLGQFVLKRACSDLYAVPDLRLSVNISPAQFRDPDVERKVADVLKETGFPVHRLELEVTEGYLIENPDRAIAAVTNLKALGVSFALDDFGTGYSSVGYLRRFNFDRIKIDKSLAGQVGVDTQAGALVAGTVSIANALGMAVTAEGVETEDHVRLLKLAGCHTLQGFYFSRPKPLAEVLEMLARDQAA